MSRLSGGHFLRHWRAVYSHSNPGMKLDRWHFEGADWTRDRHAHWGPDISFQVEIHRIMHDGRGAAAWSLLVVSERWFAEDRNKDIRTTEFCKLLSGKTETVAYWFRKHAEASLDNL